MTNISSHGDFIPTDTQDQTAARHYCLFSIVRYVPDPVREEFVNIGIVLQDKERRFAKAVQFTRDWSSAKALDPEADTDMLEALELEWIEEARSSVDFLSQLNERCSNSVRITRAQGCIVNDAGSHLNVLMQTYVEKSARFGIQLLPSQSDVA
jgi:hypothetical protein